MISLRTPFTSSTFHVIGPSPRTGVFTVVRLPNESIEAGVIEPEKSLLIGVIDLEAPVSITMGSSPGTDEVSTIGSAKGLNTP